MALRAKTVVFLHPPSSVALDILEFGFLIGMEDYLFPIRPSLTFTKWGATSSTLPISLLSFDLTFLPLSFSHGTLTIFVDGGVETPVADVPGIGAYLGILLSKSGYCFLTDSFLCI